MAFIEGDFVRVNIDKKEFPFPVSYRDHLERNILMVDKVREVEGRGVFYSLVYLSGDKYGVNSYSEELLSLWEPMEGELCLHFDLLGDPKLPVLRDYGEGSSRFLVAPFVNMFPLRVLERIEENEHKDGCK